VRTLDQRVTVRIRHTDVPPEKEYRMVTMRGASGLRDHFFIDSDGLIYMGRPLPWWGLGSRDYQTDSILVAFRRSCRDTKTKRALAVLLGFLATLPYNIVEVRYAEGMEDVKEWCTNRGVSCVREDTAEECVPSGTHEVQEVRAGEEDGG
jgi:hypothetical protein